MRQLLSVTIVAVLGGAGARAWADAPSAADALFAEGRSLIGAGQVAEACAKFEASLALDAALGTRLNLGLCWEQLGRVLDAIGALEQVVADATTAPLAPFRNLASEHLSALYARRSTLTVTLSGDAVGVDLLLQRPGVAEQALQPGARVVLDPSRDAADVVTIVARRDDAETRAAPVTLAPGATVTVELAAPTAPVEAPRPPPAGATGAPSRRGWYVAGGGVVALVASGVIGLVAKHRYDAAIADRCAGDRQACDRDGVARTDAAIALARWGATPLAVVGLAAVAVGTVLVVRDRRHAPTEAHIALTPALGIGEVGVAAVGRF